MCSVVFSTSLKYCQRCLDSMLLKKNAQLDRTGSKARRGHDVAQKWAPTLNHSYLRQTKRLDSSLKNENSHNRGSTPSWRSTDSFTSVGRSFPQERLQPDLFEPGWRKAWPLTRTPAPTFSTAVEEEKTNHRAAAATFHFYLLSLRRPPVTARRGRAVVSCSTDPTDTENSRRGYEARKSRPTGSDLKSFWRIAKAVKSKRCVKKHSNGKTAKNPGCWTQHTHTHTKPD